MNVSTEGSDAQAWVLTLASAVACVLGSTFVCFDLLVRHLPNCQDFDLKKDKKFLVGGLSLGSGVLFFTALNKILPEGLVYLETEPEDGRHILPEGSASAVLMASFVAGVLLCIVLNLFLHRLTPESIVHCGDEDEHNDTAAEEGSSTNRSASHGDDSERTPLMQRSTSGTAGSFRRCKHSESSFCAGFSNPCDHDNVCCTHATTDDRPVRVRQRSDHSHATAGEHHHHVTEERHDLMRVGLQTAFAISMHKLPEGFITFMANHRDASLGFSIFLALGIHNLIEGFTIAFPLYLAFQSRWKAIAAAFVLGGLSQPLGALVAWTITKSKLGDIENSQAFDLAYGVLFGATSGFMSVIACSLLAQAVRNDTRDGLLFTICFFVGVCIIGFAGALTE